MKPAYAIVMEALELGADVKMPNGYTYCLMTTTALRAIGYDTPTYAAGTDKAFLAVKAASSSGKFHYAFPEMEFDHFLRLCDRLNENDILAIAADIVGRKRCRS